MQSKTFEYTFRMWMACNSSNFDNLITNLEFQVAFDALNINCNNMICIFLDMMVDRIACSLFLNSLALVFMDQMYWTVKSILMTTWNRVEKIVLWKTFFLNRHVQLHYISKVNHNYDKMLSTLFRVRIIHPNHPGLYQLCDSVTGQFGTHLLLLKHMREV